MAKQTISEIPATEPEVPVKEQVKAERRQVLPDPIDRGDFIVKSRILHRVHVSEDSYTLYFGEAGAEVSESHEWTEEAKAAIAVFLAVR